MLKKKDIADSPTPDFKRENSLAMKTSM